MTVSVAKKKLYLVETKSGSGKNGNGKNGNDYQDMCMCGQKSHDEIAGGMDAEINEFPWIVRIMGGCAGGQF